MTKFRLFCALANYESIAVPYGDEMIVGHVVALEREDGSGRCFNVTMQIGNHRKTVFVRTID